MDELVRLYLFVHPYVMFALRVFMEKIQNGLKYPTENNSLTSVAYSIIPPQINNGLNTLKY